MSSNYINGQWKSYTSVFFNSYNPSNNKIVGSFPLSSEGDVNSAVTAARKAYSIWKSLSRITRAEYLDAFVEKVKEEKHKIAKLISLESGKPYNEALADVVEGIHTAQYWFGYSRMQAGEIYASEIAEKDSYVYRKPKGVIVCITPWNFPFAIPLWLICPSLVEGNTVIFKPSEETPAVAHYLVSLFNDIKLPPGVLNLVHGEGSVGSLLVNHPDTNVILFTGSYKTGQKIREQCAESYKKFFVGEMGGKNAMMVFNSANVDLALNAALLGAFKTTGQRCVSTERIFVQREVYETFIAKFVKLVKKIKIGDPLDETVFMGPLINQKAIDKFLYYNDLAKQEGVNVLLDGGIISKKANDGFFVSPFVYAMEYNKDSVVLKEEVFGPHVAIVPFDTVEEVIEMYNNCEYAFALSICTDDYRIVKTIKERCDFGVGYVNLPTIGAEVHLPFGGLKKSGSGIPSAAGLTEAVTHKVTLTVNYANEIKLAQGLKADV